MQNSAPTEQIDRQDLEEIAGIVEQVATKVNELFAEARGRNDYLALTAIQDAIDHMRGAIGDVVKKEEFLERISSHEIQSAMKKIIAAVMKIVDDFEGKNEEAIEAGLWRSRAFVGAAEYWVPGMELKRTDENIAEVLRNAVETFNVFYEADHVEINLDCPSDCVVNIHKPTVDLLIFNILGNAFRRGGAHKINIFIAQNDYNIVINVDDNGKGVDPEILSHIFEMGFSGNGSTGVGLGHADKRMEKMGGYIRCNPDGGIEGGAKFLLFLPKPESRQRRNPGLKF